MNVLVRWPKIWPVVKMWAWAWVKRHPTAILRVGFGGTALYLFYIAWSVQGDPEGAFLLGCVGTAMLVVATCDVEVDEGY